MCVCVNTQENTLSANFRTGRDVRNYLIKPYFKSHYASTKGLVGRRAEIRIINISIPNLCFSPTISNLWEKIKMPLFYCFFKSIWLIAEFYTHTHMNSAPRKTLLCKVTKDSRLPWFYSISALKKNSEEMYVLQEKEVGLLNIFARKYSNYCDNGSFI